MDGHATTVSLRQHSRVRPGSRARRQGSKAPAANCQTLSHSPRGLPWDTAGGAGAKSAKRTLTKVAYTLQDVSRPQSRDRDQVQPWDIAFASSTVPPGRRRSNSTAALPPLKGGGHHKTAAGRHGEASHAPATVAFESDAGETSPAKRPSSRDGPAKMTPLDLLSKRPPSRDGLAKQSPASLANASALAKVDLFFAKLGDALQSSSSPLAKTAGSSMWLAGSPGAQRVAWGKLATTLAVASASEKDEASGMWQPPWQLASSALAPHREPAAKSPNLKSGALPALALLMDQSPKAAPPFVSGVAPDLVIETVDNCEEQAEQWKRATVHFCDKGDEIYDMFTPYGCVYGEHPSGFNFNETGHMVANSNEAIPAADFEGIDAGSVIECITSCGVGYRVMPQFTARFEDLRTLHIGDQVKVEERSGDWLRDSIGWFPLFINNTAVVEVVRPNVPKLRLGKSRRGVMVLQTPEDREMLLMDPD